MSELTIRTCVVLSALTDAAKERVHSVARREGGQTAAEYLGIIVLVAAIIVAIFALGIPSKIAGALSKAIDSIVNGNAG